jgi:formylglycine-generating enzyme required for sulfatase activity
MNASELGYRFSPSFAVVAGLQVGNYPVAGYAGRSGLKDTNLYTAQFLSRYTFGDPDQRIRPYVDGGLNATFGGLRTGYGPSVGGGVDVALNRSLSFFVESRFNLVLPDDAIDGASNLGDAPGSATSKTDDPKGSITGPFDSVNQLLGVGIKVKFRGIKVNFRGPSQTSNDVSSETTDASPSPDTSRQEDPVRVPSGTFVMGLTDEDPLSIQNAGRKRITVSSFYIDRHEVTNAEYRDYLSRLSSDERQERLPDSTDWTEARTEESWEVYFRGDYYLEYPVIRVTWDEARAYCQARGKRLPTEAEWEYAARAGYLGRVYPWGGLTTRGQNGDYLANFKAPEGYAADGYAFTAPVDAFPPNDWGLRNMAGNVAEWTRDAYAQSYDNLSDFNPHNRSEEESRRVVRGGAWNSDSFFIGVGVRDTQPRDEASIEIGFRCASEAASLDSGDAPEDTTETGNVPE